MTPKIVNLTAQTVSKNIADALAGAPAPHQEIFSIPYYRQQLIARVLSRMQNHCLVCEDNVPSHQLAALFHPLEQQTEIDRLIREQMGRVTEENIGWTDSVQVPDYPSVFRAVDKRAT